MHRAYWGWCGAMLVLTIPRIGSLLPGSIAGSGNRRSTGRPFASLDVGMFSYVDEEEPSEFDLPPSEFDLPPSEFDLPAEDGPSEFDLQASTMESELDLPQASPPRKSLADFFPPVVDGEDEGYDPFGLPPVEAPVSAPRFPFAPPPLPSQPAHARAPLTDPRGRTRGGCPL